MRRLGRRGWGVVVELWVRVWVWLQLRLLLLPIGLAYGSGCRHGGDYHGVEKETFLRVGLRCGEYRAELDVIFFVIRGRKAWETKASPSSDVGA